MPTPLARLFAVLTRDNRRSPFTMVRSDAPRVLAALALIAAGSAAQAACPDRNLDGTPLSYSPADLRTARSFPIVNAGGMQYLGDCPAIVQGGIGYLSERPDFTLEFSANPDGLDLSFRVVGTCDTILVVNDGFVERSWHFSDDADGTIHPRITLPSASERSADRGYDIWVGTYDPTPCNATLVLQTH